MSAYRTLACAWIALFVAPHARGQDAEQASMPMHHAATTHASGQTVAVDPDHVAPPPPSAQLPAGTVHMHGDPLLAMLRVDELEGTHAADADGLAWDVQGWIGHDLDKLWFKSEGARSGGRLAESRSELLWDRAVAPFWDLQAGLRHDGGEGPARSWAAFGIQGLAPYRFETEATFYVGQGGRTAARLQFEYTLRFSQRWILAPKLAFEAYGRADPRRGIGAGVSEGSLGLRLRYEVRRQFAPYVGVVWSRRFAGTAALARERGERRGERQWVAGLRMWF